MGPMDGPTFPQIGQAEFELVMACTFDKCLLKTTRDVREKLCERTEQRETSELKYKGGN